MSRKRASRAGQALVMTGNGRGGPALGLISIVLVVLGILPVRAANSSRVNAESTPADVVLTLQGRALRGLRADVAATVFGGSEGGELQLAVLAAPIPAANEVVPVPVFVEIGGAEFLQNHRGDMARLEVYVYALGAQQRIVDFVAEAFVVDLSEFGERIWQSGLEFSTRLDLPPGTYSLRVLVRDYHSKASGLRSVPLEVPGPSSAGPLVLTPLVAGPVDRDAWLPVRSWRNLESEAPDASLAPLGLDSSPAARPVLVSGRRYDFIVPVASLADPAPAPSLELLIADDQVVTVAAEVVGREGGPAADLELVTIRFSAPESGAGRDRSPSPAGVYRARIRFGEMDEAAVSPLFEVAVVPAGTGERDLIWTDLRRLAGPVSTAVAVAPGPRSRNAVRQRTERARSDLSAGYLDVLASLASGSAEAARGKLLDLESKALRGQDAERAGDLLAAELAVARGLGASGSELLVAIVLLHRDMYERYRGSARYDLLAHSLSLLERLVELYVESGGSSAAAADMLSSFAAIKLDANLISAGRRLFGRALEHDPANAAALLGLAATFEKYGEYTQALNYLEQLALVAPDLDEGRLRLALALDRVGLRGRARELLDETLENGRTEWVRAVAFEEVGRMLLRSGKVPEAAELLEEAVKQLPGHQSLRVLAAHACDRMGRTARALEHLAAIAPDSGGVSSERFEYDRWPHGELDRALSQLLEIGQDSLVALGDALAAAKQNQRSAS